MSAVITSVATVEAATADRTGWIDAAKGLGIVLVVIGHAIGGLRDANLLASNDALLTVFYLIYTFHMPLFFFLSGMFVEKRLRAQPGPFFKSLFTRIAWPYFLWSTVQLLVISMLGSAVNTPTGFDAWRAVELLWKPTSQYWYLHALFILHLASFMVLPRYGSKGVMALALFAMAVPLLLHVKESPWSSLSPACRFGVYYAFGVVCGTRLLRGLQFDTTAALTGAAAAVTWLACALSAMAAGEAYGSIAAMPAAIAGTVAVVMLTQAPFVHRNRTLLALGRASLAIFVLHVLCVAGTRIVLNKLVGVSDVRMILLAATTAGLLGPFLAYRLAARLNWSKALGLG